MSKGKYEKRLKQLENPKYLDVDCWSLDHSVATLLASRLRAMATNPCGRPNELTFKKWKKNLDRMATAFELVLQEDYYDICSRKKEIDKGLKLFAKWFYHLCT